MARARISQRIVLAICLLAAPVLDLAQPLPVEAHCPGSPASGGRDYASGYDYLGGAANGVRANIEWTNPPDCTYGQLSGFTAEQITLCPSDSCQGWVQVGWWEIFSEGAAPVLGCEYKRTDNPTVHQFFLPLSAATHNYLWQRESNGWWTCRVDGGAPQANTGNVNFASGLWGNAQGETSVMHAQIGRVAPAKLAFSSLHYRAAGSWISMGLTLQSDGPYGRDFGGGLFRNWTNAH